MLAPWDDESFEIWTLGNRYDKYPRFDRLFEIHDNLEKHHPVYPDFLIKQGVPVVVGEKFPKKDASNVEVYPYKAVQDLIGDEYLTSSSAAMLAYALLHGYQDIYLFGVDMAIDDHEYFWQRPCMEFWVGFAKGRGVNIINHESSPMCRSDYVEGRDYGFKDLATPELKNEYTEMADGHRKQIDEKMKRLKQIIMVEHEIAELKKSITAHDGAAQAYDRLAKYERARKAGNKIHKLKDTAVFR